MAGVKTHHPDFDLACRRWEIVSDCVEGEDVIKGKGEAYLPRPAGHPRNNIGDAQYFNYQERAEFPDIIAPAIRGLIGTLHRKPARVELPARTQFLIKRATDDCLSLEGLARRLSWYIVAFGRAPLLLDVPNVPQIGVAQVRFLSYRPQQLINWREEAINGELKLTMAVLETNPLKDDQPDMFSHDKAREWRVLKLVNGVYQIDIWRETDSHKEPEMIAQDIVPTIRGMPLSEIPLLVPGATDITPDIDEIPMLGLSRLALSIYKNSADKEQGLFLAGNPTPWIAGLSPPYDAEKGKEDVSIRLGPGGGYWIPDAQGKMGFCEVEGACFDKQRDNIQDKFYRAGQMGASMLESEKRAAEAAESLRLRQASRTATLESIADSEGEAIRRLLRVAAMWTDANPDDVVYEPNKDFVDVSLSSQDLTAITESWMKGAYGRQTLHYLLQRGELLPENMNMDAYLDDIDGAIDGDQAA